MSRFRAVLGIYAVLLVLYVASLHPWPMNRAEQRMALLSHKAANEARGAILKRNRG